MTEKLSIKGKDVWVRVEQYIPEGRNPNVIPTEYFKVFYNLEEPVNNPGKVLTDRGEEPKLFESPVAALEYATEKLEEIL
jgi:hypothetical protein